MPFIPRFTPINLEAYSCLVPSKQEPGKAMSEEDLEEGAQYGALPFDYYVTVRTFLHKKIYAN